MTPPIDQSGSTEQSQSVEEDKENEYLPPGWTEDDFLELVDKVYQLFLSDLTLECERGAW
ncbi:MAG: hypothetical protein JXA42_21630 [Anaerolineales bacterium]|nr:hypothetical protein [Anaerolineales bacterium]